jgi:hypothetical protein
MVLEFCGGGDLHHVLHGIFLFFIFFSFFISFSDDKIPDDDLPWSMRVKVILDIAKVHSQILKIFRH